MLPRTFVALLCGTLVVLLLVILGSSAASSPETRAERTATKDGVLSRKRRYIVFPRGSSIQLVYCLSFRGYIPFQSIFVFGLTAGLAWQLPTDPQQVYLQRREVGRHPDREHRVNLFRSVQTFLNQRGLHGEECVQRTVCESSSPLRSKGSFMQEMVGVLFNLPQGEVDQSATSTTWDAARYNGTSCEIRFPRCSSVLDIVLPIEAQK